MLVVDKSLPPLHWSLAEDTEVKFSRDNLVRSVYLKIEGKVIQHPISNLIMILKDNSHNLFSVYCNLLNESSYSRSC